MHRLIISFIILTLLLTACGTLEVTLTNSDELTATPASASLTTGSVPLGMDSTSVEIRQLLLESPSRWQTLFMDAQAAFPDGASQHLQVWVDQPALSLRVLSGAAGKSAEALRVVDGMSQLDLNITSGESSIIPFTASETEIPFTPRAPDVTDNVIDSHPLFSSVGTPLDVLVFPSEIAQNEGTFTPIGMEVIAYRLALIVEWTYIGNALPSYRAWVDVSTGTFLRYQQFEKSGGTDILTEVTVTRVDYDLAFPASLFSTVLSAMPDFVSEPLATSVAAVTPAAPVQTDPLGWVYSFVAENGSPVRVMRLVRIPASCAVGASECPAAESIPMPVELTSSLQPLVWSPVRGEAAWMYPLNAEQRIWTLYRFDAQSGQWNELAQMERYMDPPMWSRDGEWLAFRVQDGEGGSDVYAVRRDGSDLKNLTANSALPADGKPYVMDAWLGDAVILRSAKPGGTETVVQANVTDGSVTALLEAAWTKSPLLESPQGNLLATVDDGDSQKQRIRILAADGRPLRDLATFANGSVMALTWSPDGSQLGFIHYTENMSTLYLMDNDGRNLRQVFMSPAEPQFVFSPDGQYLLVQTLDGTGEHLVAINLSTLEPFLVQAPGIALNESWLWPSWVR